MHLRLALPLPWALSLALLSPALAGDLDGNPVAAAARALGTTGTAPGATGKQPLSFKPKAERLYLDRFLLTVSDDPQQRAVFKQALLEVMQGHEQQALAGGYAHDVAGALSFALLVLQVTISGQELPDGTLPALLGQLRAALDQPGVRGATDEQKQLFYEACLCYGGTTLTLASAAGEAQAEQIKTLARGWLAELVGTEKLTLSAQGLTIVGARPAPGRTPAPTPTPTPAPTPAAGAALAAGLTWATPEGWKQEPNGWLVQRWSDPNRPNEIVSAHARFLAAVPAQGNMGDALRAAWKTGAPPELVDKVSGMVYRRFLGDGLVAWFVIGQGREKDRQADTVCTLYLIDCGPTWQPLLVAQTYEEPGQQIGAVIPISAGLSYGRSADMAEVFLAGLRCPAGKGRALVDREALVGRYRFGTSSHLQWVNVHTGSTTMTSVSYGGELDLRADGSFQWTFSSASGQVGNLQFGSDKDAGQWRIEGDRLLLRSSKDGKDRRPYRIAGLTRFQDGVQAAILMYHYDKPVNAVTVTDPADIYSTEKKE